MGLSLPVLSPGGIDVSGSPAFTVASGVAVRDVVYLSGADTAAQAQADVAGQYPAFAFVKEKPTTTSAVVQYDGELRGFSGLTAGATYYLSETAGQITTIAPIAPASIVQRVGVARNSTTLIIDIDRDFELL